MKSILYKIIPLEQMSPSLALLFCLFFLLVLGMILPAFLLLFNNSEKNSPTEDSFNKNGVLLIIPQFVFIIVIYLFNDYIHFDAAAEQFFPHYIFHNLAITNQFEYINTYPFEVLFQFDLVSLTFMLLTALLFLLCMIFILKDSNAYQVSSLLHGITLALMLAFSTSNLLLFYIAFEALLIPMYILILSSGSRERKIWAANLLFFYTVVFSLPFLLTLIYIQTQTHTLHMDIVSRVMSHENQIWLWLTAAITFASKVPLFPFHIWLPEAHVEAPTVGSVFLAGILLKLGIYGCFRIHVTSCAAVTPSLLPFLFPLFIASSVGAAYTAMRQTDIKRIIAYSSISHMGVCTLGIFCVDTPAIAGAIFQSISHALVSGALFFLVGILYKRYHSRSTLYFGGLANASPLFVIFFVFFSLANISLPGTSGFVAELTILTNSFKLYPIITVICGLSTIIGSAYSLQLCNKLVFGNLKSILTQKFSDLETHELIVLTSLAFLVCLAGIYPEPLLFIVEKAQYYDKLALGGDFSKGFLSYQFSKF